jgi:hypothetical protein
MTLKRIDRENVTLVSTDSDEFATRTEVDLHDLRSRTCDISSNIEEGELAFVESSGVKQVNLLIPCRHSKYQTLVIERRRWRISGRNSTNWFFFSQVPEERRLIQRGRKEKILVGMDIKTLDFTNMAFEKPDKFIFIQIPVSKRVVEIIPTRAYCGKSCRVYELDVVYTIFSGS